MVFGAFQQVFLIPYTVQRKILAGENFGEFGDLLQIRQSFICQLQFSLQFAKVFSRQNFPLYSIWATFRGSKGLLSGYLTIDRAHSHTPPLHSWTSSHTSFTNCGLTFNTVRKQLHLSHASVPKKVFLLMWVDRHTAHDFGFNNRGLILG